MAQFALKAAKNKLVEKQNLLKKAKKNLRKAEQEVKSAAKEYKLQVRIKRTQDVQGIQRIEGTTNLKNKMDGKTKQYDRESLKKTKSQYLSRKETQLLEFAERSKRI